MALNHIHLHKLLKILFLDSGSRQSELREDIRNEIAKEAGIETSGGDFYVPFWADAKQHVFGSADIAALVEARIAANQLRRNLYPRLRDGFLLWWNERRRWTNTPFHQGRYLKASFTFPDLEATIKVSNILSVVDGGATERAIYPYFAPAPTLSEEAARLGLWALTRALPHVAPEEFRILDVIRGRTFSLDRTPLLGSEETELRRLYESALRERANLRREYE